MDEPTGHDSVVSGSGRMCRLESEERARAFADANALALPSGRSEFRNSSTGAVPSALIKINGPIDHIRYTIKDIVACIDPAALGIGACALYSSGFFHRSPGNRAKSRSAV